MENFHNLLNTVDLVPALINSTNISRLQLLFLLMLIASLLAMALKFIEVRRKDFVFNILLVSMMIPFAALMVPLFRMFGTISHNRTVYWD